MCIRDRTVTIEIASILEDKLDRSGIDIKTAKISHACGALGYFKKVRLKDFFGILKKELSDTGSEWSDQKKVCTKIEDIGDLTYCPNEHYEDILSELARIYLGERSFGQWSAHRPVFFSNGAAPIITRIIESEGMKANEGLEKLRKKRQIARKITDKHLLRRFENLLDYSNEIGEE